MGIRFFCPNGHRLNVRAELAGEIGFCPKCQVRMLIPLESMRKSGERFVEGVSRTAEERPKNDEDGGRLPDENRPGRDEPVEAKPVVNETGTNYSTEPPVEEIIRQVAVADPAERKANSAGGAADETSDVSNALWMVNVNGQEYGPATIEVVHSWINEFRIGPKTLVWRQGWKSWREAKNVFPEIKEIFEKAEVTLDDSSKNDLFQDNHAMEAKDSQRERLVRRKRKASKSTLVIFLLILLSLGLLITLIAVLLSQK